MRLDWIENPLSHTGQTCGRSAEYLMSCALILCIFKLSGVWKRRLHCEHGNWGFACELALDAVVAVDEAIVVGVAVAFDFLQATFFDGGNTGSLAGASLIGAASMRPTLRQSRLAMGCMPCSCIE